LYSQIISIQAANITNCVFEFYSRSWRGALDTTIFDNVCQMFDKLFQRRRTDYWEDDSLGNTNVDI